MNWEHQCLNFKYIIIYITNWYSVVRCILSKLNSAAVYKYLENDHSYGRKPHGIVNYIKIQYVGLLNIF